jgi:hypothetical protein
VKTKGLVAFLVLVILLVSLVACGGGEGEAEPAEEIADAAVAAYTEQDTYQFDMDMTVEMDVTGVDETVEGTVTVDMNGASDKVNRRTYTNMQIITVPSTAMEGDVEMYNIGDWVYLKTSIPGEPPTWLKWEVCVPCGGAEKLDIVGQQVDLLEDSVGVEVIDNDTVDATECYVLEVRPELEKLWEWVQEQVALDKQLPALEPDLEEVISDFAINQWVAKDTYFILKSTLDMTLTFSSSSSSCPSCGLIPTLPGESARTYDITATMVVYDVNQPANIELPPEAEDAEEASFPMPILGPF